MTCRTCGASPDEYVVRGPAVVGWNGRVYPKETDAEAEEFASRLSVQTTVVLTGMTFRPGIDTKPRPDRV